MQFHSLSVDVVSMQIKSGEPSTFFLDSLVIKSGN